MISGDEERSLIKMNIHHILKKRTPPQQTSHKEHLTCDFVCNDENIVSYLVMCMQYPHMPEEGNRSHKTRVTGSYQLLGKCWEPNTGRVLGRATTALNWRVIFPALAFNLKWKNFQFSTVRMSFIRYRKTAISPSQLRLYFIRLMNVR